MLKHGDEGVHREGDVCGEVSIIWSDKGEVGWHIGDGHVQLTILRQRPAYEIGCDSDSDPPRVCG